MPDPSSKGPTPLVEVETLRKPSLYPDRQLAEACLVASCCKQAFGNIRFVYALPPDDQDH